MTTDPQKELDFAIFVTLFKRGASPIYSVSIRFGWQGFRDDLLKDTGAMTAQSTQSKIFRVFQSILYPIAKNGWDNGLFLSVTAVNSRGRLTPRIFNGIIREIFNNQSIDGNEYASGEAAANPGLV
jgi:hypothetical protein